VPIVGTRNNTGAIFLSGCGCWGVIFASPPTHSPAEIRFESTSGLRILTTSAKPPNAGTASGALGARQVWVAERRRSSEHKGKGSAQLLF
jgi:hypothetical protein